MFAMLMLLAALSAADPFPLAAGNDPDLARLHDAWQSPETDGDHRAEMAARLRAAAKSATPDWHAVAESYFSWRNAEATAADRRHAAVAAMIARTEAEIAARPVVCKTESISRERLFGGGVESTSTTTCDR